MPRKASSLDPWFVVGAALYWASVGFRYVGAAPTLLFKWSALADAGKYLYLCAAILVSYLAVRRLGARRSRLTLAGATLAISLAVGVVQVTLPQLGARLLLLDVALDFFTIGAFMVLWGLAFASMDKYRAAQNVTATILVTAALMLAGFALARWVPFGWLTYVLSAASSLVMLSGRVVFSSRHRERVAGQGRALAGALAQRVAFGVALGFCFEVTCRGAGAVPSLPLTALAVLAVWASLLVFWRWGSRQYATMPALLLVAIGLVYAPFLEVGGLGSVVVASAGLLWLAWSALSAVQLSDLKDRLGMSELAACLMDKLSLALSFVVGTLAFGVLGLLMGGEVGGRAVELVICGGVGALVLWTSFVMARLVSVRQEDEVRDELARTREQRAASAYDAIAREFGLSGREREVLEMLAEGYTSAYIRDVLGVSYGTAKAHVAHIYQKLDIHRKDDLLEYIDERLRDA